MHFLLVMLCKESALARIGNEGVREGLEGWRALVMHHEPPSKAQSASLLLDIMSFSFDGDINYRLVLLDREIIFRTISRSGLSCASSRRARYAST